MTAGATVDTDVVLAGRDIAKSYGVIHALKGVELRHPPRAGHDAVRRERRRQVDADEDPRRASSRRPRARSILDGEPVALRLHDRRARPRHLDHPPGAQPRAEPERPRQHLHGPRDHRRRGGVDFAEEERQTRALMEELEEDIDPPTPVEDLRLGQQQIVEIARALVGQHAHPDHGRADLGALSAAEVEVLFKVIRDLHGQGRLDRLHLAPPRGGAADHRPRRGAARRRR